MQSGEESTCANKKRHAKDKFKLSEDTLLKSLVRIYGENNWEVIAANMKERNARQCKDRWFLYLSPNINNSPWTEEEEAKLVKLVGELGPRWVKITKHFDRRTDTQIKNRWNVIKRRIKADVPISIPTELISEQLEPIKQYMNVKDSVEKAAKAADTKKQKCKDETHVELPNDVYTQEADNSVVDMYSASRFPVIDSFQNDFFNGIDADDSYFYYDE